MRILHTGSLAPKNLTPRFTALVAHLLKHLSLQVILLTLSKDSISESKCLLTCLALRSMEVSTCEYHSSVCQISLVGPKFKNWPLGPHGTLTLVRPFVSVIFFLFHKCGYLWEGEMLTSLGNTNYRAVWFLAVFSNDSVWSVDFLFSF